MDADRLIAMANQIGAFFHVRGQKAVADGVEDHIRRFWDPRMRDALLAAVDCGAVGLQPGVREGIARLSRDVNHK
jgi:formate dehydrogenase subunit delta